MSARRIDVLIFPDFQLLDAAGPIAAFEIAARMAQGAYDLRVVSTRPGWVASSSGAALRAVGPAALRPSALGAAAALLDRTFGRLEADILVLAGRALDRVHELARERARRFPRTRLEPDRIYVRDDPIWTSAGITAGIDLSLALIAEDLGEAIARATAQQLVAPRQRAGGQSQFSGLVEMGGASGRFAELLNWADQRLDARLSVEDLAEACAMSPRNFARAFVREVGMTPAKAVEHLRVEAARRRLEAGASVEEAARAAGFGDVERLRRAMLRTYGRTPQAIKRSARTAL
ncbi:MAG: hypothetical protein B7Z13_13530 [Caulobacterales bacterium 32-67-6]|nr:MAG: hypothetical protein B7Z13_13530 [Caulobacterales bacterium 32-67-6]